MRSLLDVNVLIAMLDADHTSHRVAFDWFASNAADGWASCPLTQNGCMRILAHSGYPNRRSIVEIAERLRAATSDASHEFWPDDVSVLDAKLCDLSRVHGPRQLTDVYLLALAVKHNARLVTFDGGIATTAVRGARSGNLLRL